MSKKVDKLVEEIRRCLIIWRCYSCLHELIEKPKNTFGACPKCGREGLHQLFSDDRKGLVKIVNKYTKGV